MVKRYDFVWDPMGDCYCDMDEDAEGAYVPYRDYAELEAAARVRLKHGHNDTCDGRLTPGQECSCGQDVLAKALEEGE